MMDYYTWIENGWWWKTNENTLNISLMRERRDTKEKISRAIRKQQQLGPLNSKNNAYFVSSKVNLANPINNTWKHDK